MAVLKSCGKAVREMLKCDGVESVEQISGAGPPIVVQVEYCEGDERTTFEDGLILQYEAMTAFVARYQLRNVNAMVMSEDAFTEWWEATDVENRERFFDACRNVLHEGWRCG